MTRILLAYGRGDKVVLRLCSAFGLPSPSFWLSAVPNDQPDTELGVGRLPIGIPVDTFRGTAPTRSLFSFADVLDGTCLVSRSTLRRRYSWSRLADEYGNARGNHLGQHVPEILSRIDMLDVAGMTLGHFVVRQMGWIAEEALRQVLPLVDGGIEAWDPRAVSFHGIDLTQLSVYRTPILLGDLRSGGLGIRAELSFPELKAIKVFRIMTERSDLTLELDASGHYVMTHGT
ncbi:hypothetical protein [Cryobacterium sp. TMN-39-2]|uniref:hypothetical protein n=1 Tax=Cryobacterium sp. TMN-39-2 TaxID=1259216 RepID=UPI00141B5DCB|nr:hypothetical protein [Cryobacterium sp. TMN-39-2]